MTALIWCVVGVAAAGVAASAAFYSRAGRPLSPETADRVAANALEIRRQALRLGSRPLWKFDVGMVAGTTFLVLGLLRGGPALPYAGAGAFLALTSLSGRLLVLGGRRRLQRIRQALDSS